MKTADILKGFLATAAIRIAKELGISEKAAIEAAHLVEMATPIARESRTNILAPAKAGLDADGLKVIAMVHGFRFEAEALSDRLKVAEKLIAA